MALSVISRPIGAIAKFNPITQIHKYKKPHEGHDFIPMAMEVHGIPRRDMDRY
jgi:hypothetical protein